ncbi:MAG: hypothetical protein ALECFALPRED_010023 [Alectoria fallacina]|uniref:Uncharacterized protein n=1 Tax=Alectoria fallacina TaxID=1903189 RepID=A0A8H3PKI5_9LECA|nr:MAG: hypothetical protein ALECFALPRED_010023 [Alectoria fallacina]
MSRRQSYALSDLSRTGTDDSRAHLTPYMSTEDPELLAGHGPVLNNHLQTNGLNQTSQPPEIASVGLPPDKKQQHSFYGQAFTNGWGWELLAWFLAVVSLVALIVVFAIFSDKALN